ncbi:hypothetical protein CRUP_003223 [Coryphaenoides rupestris]|nr:hypothetical protein CRUP_003223 [Coryphaenoides rupestris]
MARLRTPSSWSIICSSSVWSSALSGATEMSRTARNSPQGASTVATMSPVEWVLVMVLREIWMVQAKRRITSSMMAQ